MFSQHILASVAIDIGTSQTRIFHKNAGQIFSSPTLIAFRKGEGDINRSVIAIGAAAEKMIGRAPPSVEVVRPVINGSIVDIEAALIYIKSVMCEAIPGFWLAKPPVVCVVSSAATELDRKAFIDIFRHLGSPNIRVLPQHYAALAGIGVNFTNRGGTLVVNIGAGSTDIAITSFGTTLANTSVKIGGDDFNKSIQRFLRKKKNIEIGDATVETIKTSFGCAVQSDNFGAQAIDTAVKCLAARRAVTVKISKNELAQAIRPLLLRISDRVFNAFEAVSPDVGTDILDGFAFLTGGAAKMDSILDFFTSATAVPFQGIPDQGSCVEKGMINILAHPRDYNCFV